MSSNDSTRSRQRQALRQAIGPAPWYWNTFPAITGASGRSYRWKFHGEQGELAYLVTLSSEEAGGAPLLALNSYCRPFLIAPGRTGLWCPEAPAEQAGHPYLRLMCFDPDVMRPFSLTEIVGWFKHSSERVYAATAPLAEFEVSSGLPPGTHRIEVPPEFRTVDELLAVSSCPAARPDDPACAIFVFYLQAGLVQVLPQLWFTAKQADGYQWITRVTRDPVSHHLIGDGIRMGSFELDEDGRQLAGWIE